MWAPVIDIYPVLCNQCDNPACVASCPTGATFKRDDGIVLIDWEKCTGCRYCMAACPYGMRSFIQNKDQQRQLNPDLQAPPEGKVDKCTFCSHLVDKGQEPACVTACPAKARIFGDLDDPNSAVSKLVSDRKGFVLRQDFGTKPMVKYLK